MATKKNTKKKSTSAGSTRKTETKNSAPSINGKIDHVSIRMYCLGTGDCFVLKFLEGTVSRFTMMIDCGSCQGTDKDFKPYIDDLASYVGKHLDLLVITHEHNDHVNGFAKCESVFKDPQFTIDEAWFAWTENPDDPDDRAKKLQEKRKRMRMALATAINKFKNEADKFKVAASEDYYKMKVGESNDAFLNGLHTLAEINLSGLGVTGEPLPGMKKIKAILENKKRRDGKKTKIKYPEPGQSIAVEVLNQFKFHILGPPFERDFIFKDGREGTDVFKKKLNFYESALAVKSFLSDDSADSREQDIPFDESYIASETNRSVISKISRQSSVVDSDSLSVRASYHNLKNDWRKIETEWLSGAGTLALRLNSHINNTSLAMAIEHAPSGKVFLLPGDAEYGSWESWHEIDVWKKKGKGGVHFVEELLNRTVFYKVGHHLSYNGTALKLGINMMPTSGLVAMATLDRKRIASRWKSTMPNKFLLEELNKRCQGNCFIMNEFEIDNRPSSILDPETLGNSVYERKNFTGKKDPIYIQYRFSV
jgi:hypothetical protein